MKRRIMAIVMAAMMVFGLSTTAFAAGTQTYTDVSSTHWAYSSIESCTAKGLMQGVGNNKFDPEGTLTRAQVAQVCYNAYKDKLKGTTDKVIADVSAGAWYYDAMCWMMANGVVNGTAREGGIYCYPNATADRKYVALVLNRLAGKLGVELPKTNTAVVFPDVGKLGDEYQKAIGALQRAGVIAGFPDGTYKPDDSLTRAQAAKLFDSYTNIDGLSGSKTPPDQTSGVDDWDFVEGETYDAILKPYAESLGYTSSYYTKLTVAGSTRYCMEFVKGGNMVHVEAKTAAEGEYLLSGGAPEVWPYVVMCGSVDWVQTLKNSPMVFSAEGLHSRIYSSEFIKEKLLELS